MTTWLTLVSSPPQIVQNLLEDAARNRVSHDSLEKKIRCLLAESLPIHALRMQLRAHYDDYLADASLLTAANCTKHS
jgi:hypothetical protein